VPIDRDKDYERTSNRSSYYDIDDYNRPYYPGHASPADSRAVAIVVKRYLEAAAADDGAKACPLIYSLFEETIPETYGQSATFSPNQRGKTCAEVMTGLFAKSHAQLVAEAASVRVTAVRTNGRRGLALLRFTHIPARSIPVHRERGAWKIDALLDTEVS
jgi:hypothetical protein